MPSHEDVKSLKEKVLTEVRGVFSESTPPQYPFPVERAVDVLFKLLEHRLGDPELDAVGQQILSGISDGFERFDPVFATRCEPFAKFLLKLVKPRRYEERCKELAEHKNEQGQPQPWKMTLGHALKELNFGNGSVLNSQNPEKFRGQPRFAEHVCRVAMVRNHVHGARCYSLSEKGSIQQSIYVVLVFGAAEYLEEIESALLVAKHRQFLEGLARPFASWSKRFVSLEGREKAASARDRLQPLALVGLWESNLSKSHATGGKSSSAPQQSPSTRETSVLKQIEAHSRLVLLGAPGAGKSTLLKFVEGNHAVSLLNQSDQPVPFPIYIALQHCAPELGKTLGSRIAAALGREPETPESLFDRNVLLLLDGLNEVRENQKRLVVQEIKELVATWQRLKVVVTSRPGAYRDEFGWPVFEVNALTDSQIMEFLKGNLPDATQAVAFAEMLRQHRNLHEWGHNPLHLFMLIQTAVEHGGVLPENRGKLLQCFLRSLLQREEIQGAQQTTHLAKENLLAYFAFETRGEGQVACGKFEAIQLLKQGGERLGTNVDIPRFLQELEDNNLFVRSSGDELSFTHEMYLDYFAAVEIGNRAQLEPFLVENLQADPRWEEPLILYSGITGTRNQFISQISRLNPILAARSIASSAAPEVDLRRSINRIPEFGEVVSADSMHAHAELKDWDWLVEAIQRTEALDDSQAEAMEKADSQVNALANIIAELDLPTAKRLVEAMAAKEARQAIVMIGAWLCDQHDGTHTPQSFLCFKAGAMLGDSISMREYARCLLTGLGTDKNLFAGERWLRKAAAANTGGMRDLGGHLIKGDVLKRDAAEGERWLRKADGLGDLYASEQLGVFLLDGVLLPKNKTDGEKLLRAAAVGKAPFNIPTAMLELSDRLLNAGGGLKPNPAEGRLWLRKAVEAGHVPAIRTYALRLLVGDGFPQDLPQGQKLLREAAEAGDFWALWELGHRLVTGDGMPKDLDEGREFLNALAFTVVGGEIWAGRAPHLQVPRNVERGVKCLTAAAACGHPRAMCILGERLLEGRGIPKDQMQAEQWLRKAAGLGDEPAMQALAESLLDGIFVSKHGEEGQQWLCRAANADNAWAWVAINNCIQRHASGKGLPKDSKEVIRYLTLGLEKGHWSNDAANCLFTGAGLPCLPEEGLKLLASAAEAGFQSAMGNLGLRLLNGDGTEQDAPAGEKWLRKAAQIGNLEAMRILAIRLQDGEGMAKNAEEGELWVRKAANLDHPPAMVDLSKCLLEGIGMEKDLREGEMWLRRAAEAGCDIAMHYLAELLIDGQDLSKNVEEGENWLTSVAEMGNLEAMLSLGYRKLNGHSLPKNRKEGERWIRMSAEKGLDRAMWYLGLLLLGKKRTKQGEQWLRKGAEAGSSLAMLELGRRLLFGDQLSQNFTEGEEFLRKAAEAGHASAMFTLGTWLAQFPASVTEGEEWLRKAKEAGYGDTK